MGLSLRRAYEKAPVPGRATGRWGRDPSVQVTLYNQIDEIVRRLDRTGRVVGLVGASIAKGQVFSWKSYIINLPYQGSAGSSSQSLGVTLVEQFILLSVTFYLETATKGAKALPQLLVNGVNIFSALSAPIVFSSTADPSTQVSGPYGAYFLGGVWTLLPNGTSSYARMISAGATYQATTTGASPSSRVKAVVSGWRRQVVTQ